ncbi:hypothetical protein AB0M43_36495 [Longispora sp. NPDC051575]|uniref:hypothetical protein n=1 Tax=Longispora sp. NPDC051575 TaxID=3154943 RepID=UPI00343B3368
MSLELAAATDLLDGQGYNAVTLIGTGIALVVAVISAVYARLATLPPPRRLTITLYTSVEMNSGSKAGGSTRRPAVRYRTRIQVANDGKHAVTSAHFDQARPVLLELGVPVDKDLDVWPMNQQGATPVCAPVRTDVQLGPDLILPRSRFVIVAKTRSEPTKVGVSAPLADTTVRLRYEPYPDPPLPPRRGALAVAALGTLVLVSAAFVLGVVISH